MKAGLVGTRSAAGAMLGMLVGAGVAAAPVAEDIRDIRGPSTSAAGLGVARHHRRRSPHRAGHLWLVAWTAQSRRADFVAASKSPCIARGDRRAHEARARPGVLHCGLRYHPSLHRAKIQSDRDAPHHRRVSARPARQRRCSARTASRTAGRISASMRLREVRGPVADPAQHGIAARKCARLRFGNRRCDA